MTVYNINLGIGWASSGVEYAQAYRAKIFREMGQEAKFVFMDLILGDNIEHMTSKIGFADDEIIWLHSYFTDVKIAPSTISLAEIEAILPADPERKEVAGRLIRYHYPQDNMVVACNLRAVDEDAVETVSYFVNDKLLRKDFYSYTRYCSEYSAPKDNQAKVYQRRFYNEDGSTAYDMIVGDNNQDIYRFPDQVLYGKQEFLRYFFKRLALTKDDVVILDRETGIGQLVFEEAQAARLGVVVHAEHFSVNQTDDNYILWNNYYDFQFTNADSVDVFIVATERQKEILSQQFLIYKHQEPKIATIPVGSIDQIKEPKSPRIPFSVMTASRLATEKHIDWLIEAVVEAHEVVPDINFDIYGSGSEEAKLRQIIEEKGAKDYIQLLGHQDLSHTYMHHEVYLSGSKSEGFGLTLMEAIGSGLPLIGFDVRYGNQNFIKDEENGYLIPISELDTDQEIVESLSTKIVQIFTLANLDSMHRVSYEMAKDYLTDKVEAKWKQLITDLTNQNPASQEKNQTAEQAPVQVRDQSTDANLTNDNDKELSHD